MKLSKQEIKVLTYVRRKNSVKRSILYKKFGVSTVAKLESCGFIRCDYQPIQDDKCFEKFSEPLDALCYLTDWGNLEAASHDWLFLMFT